jgi:hypothetical protein
MRRSRSRYRERSGGHRLIRVVLALAALALALYSGSVLVRDVRLDRTLSHRGVATTGRLLDTGCRWCRAVSVDYTTTTGVKVTGVVSAIGPQADATIALKYDPLHPTAVQPAHGVVEEEVIAGALLVLAVIVLLRCLGLRLRRRRGRRRGHRVRTRGGSSPDMAGHVRVVRDN